MVSDNRRALRLLDVLSPGSSAMWFTTVPGAPKGNSRTLPAGNRIATMQELRKVFPRPVSGNLALGCVFFRPNRQRIDVDNMLKHVSDAATGIAWHDDSQVTAVMGIAELDAHNPRTIILIAHHGSSLMRDRGSERICEQCGMPFVRVSSKPQRICSWVCRLEWQKGRNRDRRIKPATPCVSCGSNTSKPGVLRCRSCWIKRSSEGPNALGLPGCLIRITAADEDKITLR